MLQYVAAAKRYHKVARLKRSTPCYDALSPLQTGQHIVLDLLPIQCFRADDFDA